MIYAAKNDTIKIMHKDRWIQGVPFLFILLLLLSACTAKYHHPVFAQTGNASWYGPGFHGKTTSNREIYDMYEMTAAHRTLPFGTYVMVTNLNNNRSVTVRINDRGPFVKNRIIDLSYAAARILDQIDPGVIPVRIEVLPHLSPDPDSQEFSVQVGAFTVASNAEALKERLERKYQNVYITRINTARQAYFRVRIKAVDRENATALAQKLQRDGFTVIILEQH